MEVTNNNSNNKMYLNEKDCQNYYCTQAGGGNTGNYFQGVRYQRGGGWFQQIYRSISPLMIKAGKYFRKKLLRAGGNVMTDIATGSSLKDALDSARHLKIYKMICFKNYNSRAAAV